MLFFFLHDFYLNFEDQLFVKVHSVYTTSPLTYHLHAPVSHRNLGPPQTSGLFVKNLGRSCQLVNFVFLFFFGLWHLTITFQLSDSTPESWTFFSFTIGTVIAVSYENTLRDGLVLGQNTNNFQDMLHPSSPSIISLSPRSFHFTSAGALDSVHCQRCFTLSFPTYLLSFT